MGSQDLYDFLQKDLYSSSCSSSSRAHCSLNIDYDDVSDDGLSELQIEGLQKEKTQKKKAISMKLKRRRSLLTSLEDAVTINALNPLQNVFNANNGRWEPPKYDIDLKGDNHSFLSPKLFHSKKLFDSNKAKKRKKKMGPIDIGRIKGFKSPKYKILNDNKLFLENYRSWYPPKHSQESQPSLVQKKTTKYHKKKNYKNRNKHKAMHNRWKSNGLNSPNLKRKFSTNSYDDHIHDLLVFDAQNCADYHYDNFPGMVFVDNYDTNRRAKKQNVRKKEHCLPWRNNIDFLEEKESSTTRKKANNTNWRRLNKKRSRTIYDINELTKNCQNKKKLKNKRSEPYPYHSGDQMINALMEDINDHQIYKNSKRRTKKLKQRKLKNTQSNHIASRSKHRMSTKKETERRKKAKSVIIKKQNKLIRNKNRKKRNSESVTKSLRNHKRDKHSRNSKNQKHKLKKTNIANTIDIDIESMDKFEVDIDIELDIDDKDDRHDNYFDIKPLLSPPSNDNENENELELEINPFLMIRDNPLNQKENELFFNSSTNKSK